MKFLWVSLNEAWKLISGADPYLMHLIWVTLQVACISTAVAVVVGVPIGLGLGLAQFRGRGLARTVANAGLGLPPVVVGVFLVLLMFPAAPLGRFHLLFTLKGVIVAQTVLALPIITALTSSAVRDIAPGLLDQARAFGASRGRVWVLAAREARVGIIAAVIAAAGSALSEVGAVVLVGGNIEGLDQTLASAALQAINGGRFITGLAIGLVLLGLILAITAALTFLQYADDRPQWTKRLS